MKESISGVIPYKILLLFLTKQNRDYKKTGLNSVILCLVLLQLVFTEIANAQTFTTPEVFSFKQDIFSPISHYTGKANVSIPLYTITTSEVNIPIVLDYIGGGGLRPLNTYGSAGFSWRISAGGVITRSINGSPDERFYNPSLKGFFFLTPNTYSNSTVRNSVLSVINNMTAELTPDIFSFSFMGHSGYFLMGYDGEFKIQSESIVKVEKNMAAYGGGAGDQLYFVLTSNNGTKYTFGYTYGSVELSGGEGVELFLANAWYLTKIKSPNGKEVNLSYHSNGSHKVHYKTSSTGSTIVNYPVVLNEISFNGNKVVFTSSMYSHYIGHMSESLRLYDKIELKDANNKVIQEITFSYSPKISKRYYILDSVKINDQRYYLTYNNTNSLPTQSQAYGTDYWGFYNGKPEKTGPVRISGRDLYLNQHLNIDEKLPSESHAKIGILTQIKKPTGESEQFEYEGNTYSNSFICGAYGEYLKSFYEEIKTAGGLRVSQITLGNYVVKYRYVIDFDPNHPDYIPGSASPLSFLSSGILYKVPATDYWNGGLINVLASEGEPPITYSRVVEFRSDKSYTIYDLTSSIDLPDISNTSNSGYYTNTAGDSKLFNYIAKQSFVNALGKNSSRALERGKPKSISYYDKNNQLKKKITFTYSQNADRYDQFVAALDIRGTAEQGLANLGGELAINYKLTSGAFSFIHSYCIYTFPVYLEKEEVTDYYNGTPVTATTKYGYNSKKLKSKVVTYDSRGDSITTKYSYPADINSGAYASMATLNMLNYPVEQITLKNTNVTGAKLTTYKSNSGSYVPDKDYILEITAPFAESSFTNFNGTTKDSRYGSSPELTYNYYSTNGNLRQVTGRDGIPTSYLWDASGMYPMAQVKGATYSQISSNDGKNCSYASNTLWSSINSAVSSSLISTYSYNALVGMASLTNNQGVTSYYTYDTSGRLFLVRDDDKNIISKYRYAYKNFPDNNIGGYTTLAVVFTYQPPYVTPGANDEATVSVTGGTGSYVYNWYLKNSSGTVISSSLNSLSSSYTFSCNQYGTYRIQCEVIDAQLGISYTKTSNAISCCSSICNFTMGSGCISLSNSIVSYGTTASFYITFYANFVMQPNVSYQVAYISSACRPSSTKTFTVYELMGRTWQVTISSTGIMYWKMTSGTALPAYESQSTGTLTYTL